MTIEHAHGMPGNHQFLIGREHPHRNAAVVAADAGLTGGIGPGSSATPSQVALSQTRSRIGAACSPMPAVKTKASSPPSAAASEPSSRAIR